MHRPIMAAEVLECLRPMPGDVAVDCTLGGGGHAEAILGRILPGGRLIGIDVDPIELAPTGARLRASRGNAVSVHVMNFACLPQALRADGLTHADVVLADLGISTMQRDDPARGFSYKVPGPLDMRMNPTAGEPASELIARLDEPDLAAILTANADEPHAALIARLLKTSSVETTQSAERIVRTGLNDARPGLAKRDVKMSVRRTFQALRIAVNEELSALDALLDCLPTVLASGGRAAILTFHSGEDRRVKRAFRDGFRSGVYSAYARAAVQSSKAETFSDHRAGAAKLRWAVRA